MEPEAPAFWIEAEAIEVLSLSDELLAEALEPPAKPAPSRLEDWVDFRLTVDQASLIHDKLYRKIHRKVHRRRPSRPLKVGDAFTDPRHLLDVLWRALDEVPATTPVSVSKRGNVQVRDREFMLRLRRHEAAYFRKIIQNQDLDDLRRQEYEEELFATLDEGELAEEGLEPEQLTDGIRRSFIYRTHNETPHAHLRQFFLKEAFAELPAKLKMPPKDVNSLLSELAAAGGNVSKAARELGQPQRKTARRVARILRHLESRGFSA